MRGALRAGCIAHRVPFIVLSGLRIASRVPCAASSASRITSFALRFVLRATRIAFPASRPLRPGPTSKTTGTDSKPLTRLH